MGGQSISVEDKLRERIKELTCLYDVTSIILQDNDDVSATLEKIAHALKKAYRFADDAVVELRLGDFYVLTAPLPHDSVFQHNDILVSGSPGGYIKAHYPSGRYNQSHFLEDEIKLLAKVALETGTYYEKKLALQKEELFKRGMERADRLGILGEITAGIAHELNTPLGNILGYAELISQESSDRQVNKDISKIINAAIYSREIVKKLMFFACEMPQNLDKVKVVPLVYQALSFLGPNFKKKDIDYRFTYDDDALEARLDEIQFTQVLFNILINAIYVSPPSGSIGISLYTGGGSFCIEVADKGPGIPDAEKSKIFEPFFTTKPLGEGTGLGLSMVHGIVRAHGGDIVVLDNAGGGTVFKIRIPLTH